MTDFRALSRKYTHDEFLVTRRGVITLDGVRIFALDIDAPEKDKKQVDAYVTDTMGKFFHRKQTGDGRWRYLLYDA